MSRALRLLLLAAPLAAAPPILTRAQWGARPALVRREPPMPEVTEGPRRVAVENTLPPRRPARHLTVHHTARPASALPLAENLRAFQRQMADYTIDLGPGLSKRVFLGDLPYHFFIDATGAIGEGRELAYAAYSNTVYRTPLAEHITVVLDGNFETGEPTGAQVAALTELLAHLATTHGVPRAAIGVHGDQADTLCPGRHLRARMAEVDRALAARGVK